MAQQLNLALSQQADSDDPFSHNRRSKPNLHQVKRLKSKGRSERFGPVSNGIAGVAWPPPSWRSSGRGLPQEDRDPAAPAPQLGGKAALALFGLLQRRRIVDGVDLNGIAETVSAHQVESIIQIGPPGPCEKG